MAQIKALIENQKEEHKANTALGISLPISSFISLLRTIAFFTQNKSQWMIDTEAIDHMCMTHVNLLKRKQVEPPIFVRMATNELALAQSSRNVMLNNKIELKNVLQLNNFDANLISITRLTKDLYCSVIFYHDFCAIQDS